MFLEFPVVVGILLGRSDCSIVFGIGAGDLHSKESMRGIEGRAWENALGSGSNAATRS